MRLTVGTKVRLMHEVDRYPHFIAAKGMVGVVSHADEHTVCVRMDEHLPGAEEWDNEVVWSVGDGDDPARDVEIVEPTPHL